MTTAPCAAGTYRSAQAGEQRKADDNTSGYHGKTRQKRSPGPSRPRCDEHDRCEKRGNDCAAEPDKHRIERRDGNPRRRKDKAEARDADEPPEESDATLTWSRHPCSSRGDWGSHMGMALRTLARQARSVWAVESKPLIIIDLLHNSNRQ
jgi:hypothetical protein